MKSLWAHFSAEMLNEEELNWACSLGLADVVLGAFPEAIQAAREAGLRPWACLGAFAASAEEKELLCRSIAGEPRLWFGSGCPNHPQVQRRLLERVEEVVSWGVAGVFLDGIRFASPYEGLETFATCTCQWCARAAEELGFHWGDVLAGLQATASWLQRAGEAALCAREGWFSPSDLLEGLRALRAPAEWLSFRALAIARVVSQVRRALKARAPHMRLAAYLFPPSLAPLVGQDYRLLAQDLEVISPMIYRLGDGPATLPAEMNGLSQMLGLDSAAGAQALSAFFGFQLLTSADERTVEAVEVRAIELEVRRARSRAGCSSAIVPILWLQDGQIGASVRAALAGRPDGLSFFALGPATKAQFAAAAQAFRSLSGL